MALSDKSGIAERLARFFAIVKIYGLLSKYLVIFVAFAGDQYAVAGLGRFYGQLDCQTAVRLDDKTFFSVP